MSETITIYGGLDRIGKLRKAAVKREAKRRGISVSDVVWDILIKSGSPELRADLEAVEKRRV